MILNLCFHGIGECRTEREPGESRYWIGRRLFLEVLDRVMDRPDVELSFDDGNRSDLEIALPALEERGLHAAFFPLAGRLGDSLSLGPADLNVLREHGMSIGSHGWSHVPWRRLGRPDAQREFAAARTALEDACGQSVDEAACPLGRYDRGTLRQLRDAGYRAVFTSDRFPTRRSSWLRARYSLTADDSVESVSRILRMRPGPAEGRNLLASLVKRSR